MDGGEGRRGSWMEGGEGRGGSSVPGLLPLIEPVYQEPQYCEPGKVDL